MARTQKHKLVTELEVKDKGSQAVKKISSEMKFLSAASLGATGGMTSMVGQLGKLAPALAITAAGFITLKKGIEAFTKAMIESSKSAINFENELNKIGTLLTGNIDRQLDDMGDRIIELGLNWGFAMDKLAKVNYDAISSGLADTSEEAARITQQVSALALAGQGELVPTFNLVAFVMKAYNVEAEKAGFVTQKLNHLVEEGKTTIAQLADPLSKIANSSAQAGISIDHLFSALASASPFKSLDIVSTEFDAFVRSLQKPQGHLKDALMDLGIGDVLRYITESGGDFMPLIEKLQSWAKQEGLYLSELFDEARARRFLLLTENEEFLTSYYDYFKGINTETDNFLDDIDRMRDSTKHLGQQITNLWETIKIYIGNIILPYIKEAFKWILGLGKGIASVFKSSSEGAQRGQKDFNDLFRILSVGAKIINGMIFAVRTFTGALALMADPLIRAFTGIVFLIGNIAEVATKGIDLIIKGINKVTGSNIKEIGFNFKSDQFVSDMKAIQTLNASVIDQAKTAKSDYDALDKVIRNVKPVSLEARDLFDASEFEAPTDIVSPELIPEGERFSEDDGKKAGSRSARGLTDPNLLLNVVMYGNDLATIANTYLKNIVVNTGGVKGNIGETDFNLQQGVPNL